MLSCEFGQGVKDIALVISPKLYNFKSFIGQHYGIPLKRHEPVIINRLLGVSTFERQDGKKPTKKELQPHIDDLLESCDTLGIKYLIIANAEYFKWLTGRKGLEDSLGLSYQCVIAGYEHLTIFPMINASILLAQPNKKILLDKAIRVVGETINGSFQKPKAFEFESYELVQNPQRAKVVLDSLLDKPRLFVDIETTGLRLGEAEILTLAISYDKYNAVTFACHELYLSAEHSVFMVDALKDFFTKYGQQLTFHNGLFDVKHMIYNWWMEDFDDVKGMYQGLDALDFDDTFILAYCKYNSTERPALDLKTLSKDFLGEYAVDVKDCTTVDLDTLAEYNAKDCCGTAYVYDLVQDQLDTRIYTEIMYPSYRPLLIMMMNGLPIDLDRVTEASATVVGQLEKAKDILKYSRYVKETEDILANLQMLKYNATHVKQKEVWEFMPDFNPGSPNQLRMLLFDVMGYESVEETKTGQSSTKRDVITEIMSYESDEEKLETLQAIVDVSMASIVENTFLSAFTELSITQNGRSHLHGNLRLGGTQSGRLSSSEPELI
jgi:DNA polymerase-1